jgi:hypothetical protein
VLRLHSRATAGDLAQREAGIALYEAFDRRCPSMAALAAAAFVAIFFFAVPIPLCVLTAGVVALSGARASVPAFLVVRLKAETIATLAACAGAGVVLSYARCHRSAVQASAPTSIV